MSAQLLLLNLFGAVALLVWATRMVRTGVSRAFGERLRQIVQAATANPVVACGAGVGVAAMVQSSAATALLVAGFAQRGLIALGPALALMLGADVGSTLVVQALAFDLSAVIPVLLVVGVAAFMLSSSALVRQLGRVVIGIALMILALGLLVAASEPLRTNDVLPLVLQRLADEPFLALAIGAALAWLVHSSVATVLVVVSLAIAGVVEPKLAFALVLGANVGSGLIPLGINLGAPAAVRRVLLGNLAFRFLGALAALALLEPAAALLAAVDSDPARLVANYHTAFNLALVVVFLPLTGATARLLERLQPDPAPPAAARQLGYLDDAVLDRPTMALAGATREVLRLAETVEIMLREAILPFAESDGTRRTEIKRLDITVDRLQEDIKLYLTRLTRHPLSDEDSRRAFDLILFTTNLEHVGDIIDKSLLELAAKKQRLDLEFSPEGWGELQRLHALAVAQMQHAVTVFVTADVTMARELVETKERVREIERAATEGHLRRLREGTTASIETSSLHLDMIRDLKRIIAHLTTVAHPILQATGELRDSRLRRPAGDAATSTPA